jgi:hypothetical protein
MLNFFSAGYLGHFEIMDMIRVNNIVPTYDAATGTKWFNFRGDLITYDDRDTWNTKANYARSSCLGGVMVWAIDLVVERRFLALRFGFFILVFNSAYPFCFAKSETEPVVNVQTAIALSRESSRSLFFLPGPCSYFAQN